MAALVALPVLAASAAGAAWFAYTQVGRTPDEIIDYVKRRMVGHSTLERVALPVLDQLRLLFGGLDEVALQLPFFVPPLARNPATPAAPALSGAATGRVLHVGPRRAITRIGVAAQEAGDGDVIEIDPGDYVADVAIWDRAELTIRGAGNRVRLLAAGAHAEGKAIWVIRRGRITIENIEFIGARVPDNNGAGIRHEGGQLIVRRCGFRNNQNGILTGSDPKSTLEVESSEFGYNGAGDGLSHGIYVGAIASFRLSGSYVHHGNVGHLVKTRARHNRIEYNRLSDEAGGRSSYELEFPNGGVAEVVGNIIQQGAGTRNSVIVSYGAEGYGGRSNSLSFVHNTLVNDEVRGGTFLRVAPGAVAVVLRNNLWVGRGKIDASAQAVASGDRRADWGDLERPAREDYRPGATAQADWQVTPMAPVPSALLPHWQYQHPMSMRPLAGVPRWPGALQPASP